VAYAHELIHRQGRKNINMVGDDVTSSNVREYHFIKEIKIRWNVVAGNEVGLIFYVRKGALSVPRKSVGIWIVQ
jgi:hypothetical protein